MPDLEFYDDPAVFLARAEGLLAAEPVLTTVVSSVTSRAVADDERDDLPPAHPRWWLLVRGEAGEAVGAAMRTAPFEPHPLFVLPMPAAAATALAAALVTRGERVDGVNGALPAARLVADEVARATGRRVHVEERIRLWELGDLVPPVAAPGRLRAVTPDEVDLVRQWWTAFFVAANEQAGRPGAHHGEPLSAHEALRRIEDGLLWLWEGTDGEVVHLTAHSRPAYGVARVGPVYTPPEHRGRGYASSAVAAVAQQLRDAGSRVCLYTDQANPTSNRIYEQLGFRPVTEMANLLVRND